MFIKTFYPAMAAAGAAPSVEPLAPSGPFCGAPCLSGPKFLGRGGSR